MLSDVPLCLWLSLGVAGCRWLSLRVFGCPWLSLGVAGYRWMSLDVLFWMSLMSLDVAGCRCMSLVVAGCLWLSPLGVSRCPWFSLLVAVCLVSGCRRTRCTALASSDLEKLVLFLSSLTNVAGCRYISLDVLLWMSLDVAGCR